MMLPAKREETARVPSGQALSIGGAEEEEEGRYSYFLHFDCE
jgi:hypothetical protein